MIFRVPGGPVGFQTRLAGFDSPAVCQSRFAVGARPALERAVLWTLTLPPLIRDGRRFIKKEKYDREIRYGKVWSLWHGNINRKCGVVCRGMPNHQGNFLLDMTEKVGLALAIMSATVLNVILLCLAMKVMFF